MTPAADTARDNPWAVASVAASYERHLVPILFEPWARTLVRIADPQPDERVLDIACGTGIVARTVAARRASPARITGIDINGDMLAIARRAGPGIDWRLGDATTTGLPDACFDIAFCQQGLQFLTDPIAALRHWHAVLAPGGRLVVSTWHDDENPGYAPIRAAFERHLAEPATGIRFLQAIFALGDGAHLERLLAGAGFRDLSVDLHTDVVTCPTPHAWIEGFLAAAPVHAIATLTREAREQIITEVVRDLSGHITSDGSLAFPLQSTVAVARR